jgi:carboxyl-terminal processing protease
LSAILLAGVVGFRLPAVQATPAPSDQLLRRAEEFEAKQQWRDACAIYDQLLTQNRNALDIRDRYQKCLRHLHQVRRHREPSFRQALGNLKLPSQSLKIYEQVLEVLRAHYVEMPRTEPAELFRQGLLELRFALEDDAFTQEYLIGVKPEGLAAFAKVLREWNSAGIQSRADARKQLFKIVESARDELGLAPAVVVFEFICGACNSLDEYTAYLTPTQLKEVQACLRGKSASIGLELAVLDQKIVICQVHPDGPAARLLKVGDRLVRIDHQAVDPALPGEARARLRGDSGSTVEIEVMSSGDMLSRALRFERQPLLMPSVEVEPEPRNGVGYIRILGFTETTPQELKDGILRLQGAGMKALILDLRGNPGGLFKSATEIAEMFLPEGLIVHTQSRQKEFNETVRSHNVNALNLPLVVLVDGETASSAEILAGALKENERARLIGQPTFGKGSIQWVVPLKSPASGVRITVARFISPSGQPYTGRGVIPHLLVEQLGMMADSQRLAAERDAVQMVMMMR